MTAKSTLASLVVCIGLSGSVSGDAATTPPSNDPAAHPGKLVVLPDGRRLNFRCTGHGAPTILLESGYAADSLAWYKVQPELSRRYRVCAYDRAGAGFSDPGPTPRDGAAIVRDLDQGLRAGGIGGPFVLVGHSAGGLYVRLFADLRAKDVVGMVLVDPSLTYQDRRFADRFGPGAGSPQSLIDRDSRCLAAARADTLPSEDPTLKPCVPKPGGDPAVNATHIAHAREPGKWIDQISELETLWRATSDEVANGRSSYADMPLIVLTASGTNSGIPAAARPAVDALWSDGHREIAATSSRGREELVDRTSHMMMLDRPDAIITAVDDVARPSTKGPVSKRPAETGRSTRS